MTSIDSQINLAHREVGTGKLPGGEGRAVVMRRTCDAPIEEVWDACTNAERIGQWLSTIAGDLREGGRYQLEGNASGEIQRCEAPNLIKVTWEFGGGPPSELEVRLTPDESGGTVVELEHVAIVDPELWRTYGPGAVGVGWDLSMLGLHMHLSGEVIEDREKWDESPEVKDFIARSSAAWGDALERSGASADEAAKAAENTTAFYGASSSE